MSEVVTNPLFTHRASPVDAKATGETHYNVRREDIVNDVGITNIYDGEFTYIKDPTLEIDLKLWEDNDSNESFKQYLLMTTQGGFQVAMADDFKVAEHLSLTWKRDESGRLTMGGRSKLTMVLMWRTGEKAAEARKRLLAASDSVHESVEEKQARMGDKYAPLGADVRVTFEDDDGTDEVRNPQRRRAARRR